MLENDFRICCQKFLHCDEIISLKIPNLGGYSRKFSFDIYFISSNKEKGQSTTKSQKISAIKELIFIEKIFKDKKIQNLNLKQQLKEDWEDLTTKQQDLKDKFIKFDQFIKDNDQKRKRTNKQIQNYKNKQKEYLNTISLLKYKTDYLKNLKHELEKECLSLNIYQRFLDNCVVKYSNKYKEPLDILNNYETLGNTKENLKLHQDALMINIESLNEQLIIIQEEHNRKYFSLNKEKIILEEKLNQIKNECLDWESVIYKTKIDIDKRNTEKEKLVNACWNIYILLNNRIKQPVLSKHDDFLAQLSLIKEGIVLSKKMIFLSKYFLEHSIDK